MTHHLANFRNAVYTDPRVNRDSALNVIPFRTIRILRHEPLDQARWSGIHAARFRGNTRERSKRVRGELGRSGELRYASRCQGLAKFDKAKKARIQFSAADRLNILSANDNEVRATVFVLSSTQVSSERFSSSSYSIQACVSPCCFR